MISATTLAKKAMLRILPPIYRLACQSPLYSVLHVREPSWMTPERSGALLSALVARPQAVPSCSAAAVAAAHAHSEGDLFTILLPMLVPLAITPCMNGQRTPETNLTWAHTRPYPCILRGLRLWENLPRQDEGELGIPVNAKGVPWDVDVTARFFGYSMIGFPLTELIPRVFQLLQW